jgi:hypothetical protein
MGVIGPADGWEANRQGKSELEQEFDWMPHNDSG